MCIFSGERTDLRVAGTRIYGRLDGDRQCLIYAMQLASREDVAMILPVPVVAGAPDDAMQFVDLSEHATLFDDLAMLFAPPPSAFGPPQRGPAPLDLSARLVVHEVGAFVASFVPRLADFSRLDPRFRLPDAVWAALPQYADWGFAVFQLAKGDAKLHPMAFHFPTRAPSRVFFPTVHVHDGSVRDLAAFDHELYWQGAPEGHPTDGVSLVPVSASMAERSKGLLVAASARRRVMRGHHENADVWI